MAKRRCPKKVREWRAHIVRWRASGLSMRAFAKLEGVSAQSIAYWRARLGDGPECDAAPEASFAPVTIVPEMPGHGAGVQAPQEHAGFEVHLAGGARISVPPGFALSDLKHLVEVVGS